jgi:uncharacterized protein YjlB
MEGDSTFDEKVFASLRLLETFSLFRNTEIPGRSGDTSTAKISTFVPHQVDSPGHSAKPLARCESPITPTMNYEKHLLTDGGTCPNNPRVPLLIYRRVHGATGPEELAEWFEERFDANGWPPAWRYTIYDYAHYHSTSHEVIGIYRGSATVRFGDRAGITAELQAGDAVLIPAGVSHQRLGGTGDFHGVGAYPEGCAPDILRCQPGERPAADERIAAVAMPALDPIFGEEGPMKREWQSARQA